MSTTVSNEHEDPRSCGSYSCSTSALSENELKYKKELDIVDIEKQILELNKHKSHQTHASESKHVCSNIQTSSHFEGTSNSSLNISSSVIEESHNIAYQETNDNNNIKMNDIGETRDDHDKNEKCLHDDDIGDTLETTSDYSSLNENIKLESIEDELDMDRSELVSVYTREEAAVTELVDRILDYNLLIGELSDELDILTLEGDPNENIDSLLADEESIYNEIDSVRSLLQSVIDLCAYQRKEMSENLALLDRLDTKVRTKKAGYEILRSGEWRTNSNSAPRSLLKYSKEKKYLSVGQGGEDRENTSVV